METLIPTTSHVLWPNLVGVECFGTQHGSWALGPTLSEAEENNPGIGDKLGQVCTQYNLDALYMPNPSRFNAVVVHRDSFNRWHGPVMRGPFADGVRLTEAKTAFGVASSDCPTIILYDPYHGDIVAAHAGRDSLIDRECLEGRAPSRRYFSVVDAMVDAVGRERVRYCRAFIVCGIHPNNFPHPDNDKEHGQTNLYINRHIINMWSRYCLPNGVRKGHLSLTEIIRRQFATYGLDAGRIGTDGADTYDDRSPDNRPLWHSHRRDRDFHTNSDVPGRNFVLVRHL